MKHEAFYSTTATVMPVLFIFIALTPSQFKRVLYWPKELTELRGMWLSLFGVISIVWALFGEVFALSALMQNRDVSVLRILVFSAILLLLAHALVSLVGARAFVASGDEGRSER